MEGYVPDEAERAGRDESRPKPGERTRTHTRDDGVELRARDVGIGEDALHRGSEDLGVGERVSELPNRPTTTSSRRSATVAAAEVSMARRSTGPA
ncbi:hypothetical protein MN0502_24600 [Arthrobacter sp. MN05-02]|nr:hypothetical protein MN0502_24600 [Arthrobacter sp. MN05-02]